VKFNKFRKEMPLSCSAFRCKNRWRKGQNITFHSFPRSRPHLLMQWLVSMRRKDFTPTAACKLCSVHFEESCFDRTGQTVRLRDHVVPTIFNFPKHLQKVNWPKVIRPQNLVSVTSTTLTVEQAVKDSDHISQSLCSGSFAKKSCPDPHTVEASQQDVLSSDFSTLPVHNENYLVQDSPRCLKHKLDVMCEKYCQAKKDLKIAHQKCRRQKLKITALIKIIDRLKDEHMVSESFVNILEKSMLDLDE